MVSFSLVSMHALPLILAKALPTGVARQKISKLSAKIAVEWKAMSTEEKHTATDHLVEEVNDLRQTKAVGARHLPTVIFNDTHKTLTNMEKEVCCYKHYPTFTDLQCLIDTQSSRPYWCGDHSIRGMD